MRTLSIRPVAASLVLAAALAACGGATGTPSSQSGAEGALCTAIDAFAASVMAMTGLDPATASIDDVQAAKTTAQAAWDQVKAAAANIPEADEAALEAAWTGLSGAVDEFPQDVPIASAVSTVQIAAAAIPAAVTEMKNGVNCP